VIDLLERTVNKARVAFFKKGHSDSPTYVKKIDYEWSHFGAVEGDKAKRVDCGNDLIYTILYFAPKGSSFPPHFHENKETGIVLAGSVQVETPTEKYNLTTSQSYEIFAEKWHKFYFLSDTTLMLFFHPPFLNNNWIGTLKQ
jgi:quercetin dioxygenase-like cupin family protein